MIVHEPRHTPGPWRAHPNRDYPGQHFIQSHGTTGYLIATVRGANGGDDDGPLGYVPVATPMTDANAHLIAAAPAMYLALERALTGFKAYGKRPVACLDEVIAEMEAALKLAAGGA